MTGCGDYEPMAKKETKIFSLSGEIPVLGNFMLLKRSCLCMHDLMWTGAGADGAGLGINRPTFPPGGG